MPRRLAACDPCRQSKVACDHSRPACSRCLENDQGSECFYRNRPFKRRRESSRVSQQRVSSLASSPHTSQNEDANQTLTKPHGYPNPGYLGPSSHTTIFNHVLSNSNDEGESPVSRSREKELGSPHELVDEATICDGADFIRKIQVSNCISISQIPMCVTLIKSWTATGVNLALAGDFVEPLIETAGSFLSSLGAHRTNTAEIAKNLSLHSRSQILLHENSTIDDFRANLRTQEARWETLGLFFIAASRAAIDTSIFYSLYQTEKQRLDFQRLALHYSDRCLDIALSLDCLNDLQLILQYENFILHAWLDGDQNYRSWRKLGDVISSLYALGYHERLGDSTLVPTFLRDLRRAAFLRTYSADKNISIFLGRPPRINRRFCRELLQDLRAVRLVDLVSTESQQDHIKRFNYMIETCWSARCAYLKEEILDLFRVEDRGDRQLKARTLQADIGNLWLELPIRYRLESHLRLCQQTAVEKDFMASARLNHLHVGFLLRLALVRMPEPDLQLLQLSVSMLSLVVEMIVFKNELANSGTGLVWRVAYYGLPAAGIICLSLINRSFPLYDERFSLSKVYKSLSALVTEIEVGPLLTPSHPEYSLLAKAANTINTVLDKVWRIELPLRELEREAASNLSHSLPMYNGSEWDPWPNHEVFDFEVDFWLNLAEHPTLTDTRPDSLNP